VRKHTSESRRAVRHSTTANTSSASIAAGAVHKQLDGEEPTELLGYTLLRLSAAQGRRASCAELGRCVRAPGRPRKRTRPASRRELERLLHRQRRLMARARETGSTRGQARHLPA